MAFTVGATSAKDSGGTAIPGGLLSADVAGGGVGPTFFFHGLVDGVAGSNKAQITSANALKVEDTSVQVDDAAFTPATSKVSMFGAEFDDTSPDSVDEGDGGAVRMSGNRNLYVRIRDDAGNERGLRIDANGALAATLAAGATSIGKAEDVASADGDVGVPAMAIRKAAPANTSGTDGDWEALQMSAGRLWTTAGIDQTTDLTTNKVRAFIHDGTTALPVLAGSSGAPAASSPALPVSIRDVNANGSALAASSAPVVNAPTTFRIAVTPTVTAGAYTAGNVLGGIMTFANALIGTPTASPTKWSAILESICVKFKAAAVTGEIDVAIFTASPSGGTYTDKTAPTANSADQAKLVGIFSLPTPMSTLGTMTCYNLDGIGAAIDGASTSLFVVVTVKGTPTPASTSDVIVELGVLQG